MITSDTIREIIDDVVSLDSLNSSVLDVEKADFLYFLKDLYPNECKPFEREINNLISDWD